MSDEPSCSNVLDPQLPRCAWLLACSVSRKDASPQSSASARRIPVRILSGNGVHRFRNHCSTSPEYAGVGEIERGGVFQSQQDVELSSHVGCTGKSCVIYVFRTDSGVSHEAIGGLHVSGRAGRLHNGLSYILSQGGGDPNQTASPTRIIQLGMCKEGVSPKVGIGDEHRALAKLSVSELRSLKSKKIPLF